MNFMQIIFHIARADFYERTRRYSFLITVGVMIYLAYLSMPPKTADYLIIAHDDFRGIYNSAWVGSSVALLCSVFLGLFGYYLIKNTIERDTITGVGQIIATTPIKKWLYLVGKMFSNLFFLMTIVMIISLASIVMQLIRGESYEIELWSYFAPVLLSTLPLMFLVSATAVFFEVFKWLKGGIGNVLYYMIFMFALVFSIERDDDSIGTQIIIEPFAISTITGSMQEAVKDNFPEYNGGVNIGGYEVKDKVRTFEWQGAEWTNEIILWRFFWIMISFLIITISSFFFRRFDPAYGSKKTKKEKIKKKKAAPEEETEMKQNGLFAKIHLSPLKQEKSSSVNLFVLILKAELKLMLNGLNKWWYIAAAGIITAGIAVPLEMAVKFILPIGFILPLLIWSKMGNREHSSLTNQYMFSVPFPLNRQLPAIWCAGFIIALISGIAWPIKMIFAGQFEYLIPWIIGSAFIPTLALAFGSVSKTSKLFEVFYFFLWYVGMVEKVFVFDFIGLSEKTLASNISFYYLVITLGLIVITYLGRRRQIYV